MLFFYAPNSGIPGVTGPGLQPFAKAFTQMKFPPFTAACGRTNNRLPSGGMDCDAPGVALQKLIGARALSTASDEETKDLKHFLSRFRLTEADYEALFNTYYKDLRSHSTDAVARDEAIRGAACSWVQGNRESSWENGGPGSPMAWIRYSRTHQSIFDNELDEACLRDGVYIQWCVCGCLAVPIMIFLWRQNRANVAAAVHEDDSLYEDDYAV